MTTDNHMVHTDDGATLHTVRWMPENAEPDTLVVLVHGIGEHSGRYTHVAARLVDAGYGVYALDHRGHGNSSGTRVYFDSPDQPVDDLKTVFDYIREQHGEKRYFMVGHSMGSLITLSFALRYQYELNGVISSGTPLNLDSESPGWLLALGRIVGKYLPKVPLVSLELDALSRDPSIISDYKADPLVYDRPVRAGMAAFLVDHSVTVRESLYQLRVPLLIMHGGADRVTPPSGSQFIMDNAGSPDKTLHIYPDLYHEIFNEPERDLVLSDLVAWLNAHQP